MPHTPKYVFVLVHGDMWGAYNANALVKSVKEHGAEPILIVSRSTPGKDGKPLTKVSELVPSRVLKEETMLKYFNLIDESERLADRQEKLDKGKRKERPQARKLTFKQLAQHYCADGEVHYTTTGGKKGGEEIQAIFDELKAKGITPEVVLSGDTLAILPETITANYDCFGLHPGPLPFIKGMQGTERSLINHMFYDHEGRYLEPGSYLPGGNTHIKGCFFHLAPKLDEGTVIDEGLTFVCPGMDLLQVRSELYEALVDKMVSRMPELLNKDLRKAMILFSKACYALSGKGKNAKEIADLTSDQLSQWHGDGTAYVTAGEKLSDKIWTPRDTADRVDIMQNLIVYPPYFKLCMTDFFPGARGEFKLSSPDVVPEGATVKKRNGEDDIQFSPAFEAAFEPLFRAQLDAITQQAKQSKGIDMLELERIEREINAGTFSDQMTPDEVEMNALINKVNGTQGKQYPVRVRHKWVDGTLHREREPGSGGRKH